MKKEKQLTAVQWLVNQLETGFNYNILEEDGYKKQRKIIFQEALELEHAQHQLLKMGTKFLQSVERYTNTNTTGYKAIYSNGLDFQTLFFPIKNGIDIINIPSIIKLVQLKEDFEAIGAEFYMPEL